MTMGDAEAAELQAEMIAIQAVLMGVFRRLARDRPDLTSLFCQAFDEAETVVTGLATKAGLEHALGTTTGAPRVIEQLRLAVIGDDSACREGASPSLQAAGASCAS